MSMENAPAGPALPSELAGLLFDKDGTLFGFQATWGGWASDLVRMLAPGDKGAQAKLAAALRLDLATRLFHADSPIIAGTVDESVDLMLPALHGWSFERLKDRVIDESRSVQPVEAVPLAPLFSRLSRAGLALGIATNDSEDPTRAQLAGLSLETAFDFIAGADSGFGAKPGPGQCLAFADVVGLDPSRIAMIGDSTHDLRAGGAAGMVRVGVLTGVAEAADLAPEADVVFPDIGHLPGWLGL